jgi:Flp pilus assembly protein CpaB
MAQEAPVVHNRRLLIVAAVLGLVVVILFNVQTQAIRTSLQGTQLPALTVTRDLRPGETIKPEDVTSTTVSSDTVNAFGNAISRQDFDNVQMTTNQSVPKGRTLLWAYVVKGDAANRPSNIIASGMENYPLKVIPEETPGDLIRVGDYVNVYGLFSVANKPPESYLILKAARVLTVGGKGPKDRPVGSKAGDEGQANYRSINIEVSDVVGRQLDNLMSHSIGTALRVRLRNANDTIAYLTPPGPQIETELKSLITTAAGPKPGGGL